ncbi:hypothetical protein MUP35_01665 [Patescibacteria group bacterium]|nr:hypothetical protein [Patescibacteria group bacterium]
MSELVIMLSVPKGVQWSPLTFLVRFSEFPKRLFPFKFFGLYHSSHASILIDGMVYEAVFYLGCRKIEYEKWIKLNKVNKTKTLNLCPERIHDSKLYLEGSLGIPYSNMENVIIFCNRILTFIFQKEIKIPYKSRKRKIKCTELCYEILKMNDVIWGLQDANTVGIRDLENLLNESD